ncbi:hypothetical protein HPB51_002269 [Rhipicephalus microplus]|uniref:Uncharacterized protein n=1 Tax=Rhipicephalus microplus TaxID=6941 RepID=A0A9J6DY07_RHIMP|nr:hypothetical protein HPB51_002269 [Rhipicephalus microplus]
MFLASCPVRCQFTLVDELVAPATHILQARMMGQTNIGLVTFEGLKVPVYVRFYGDKLRCYPHRPRQVVCQICLELGHRDDNCSTLAVVICPTCGTDNPTQSHPCTPHCKSCDGPHPTMDPNCPQRERLVLNKALCWKPSKMNCVNSNPPVTIPCRERQPRPTIHALR